MKYTNSYFFLTLLFGASFTSPISAKDLIDELFEQESVFENSFILGVSTDSYDSKTYDLDLSLSINSLTQFIFYTEYSDFSATSINYNNRSFDLGLRYQADDTINLGINYVTSGQEQPLTSQTLRGTLSYYANDWDFSIFPETSKIKIKYLRRDVTQTAIGSSLNYYGINPLEFSVSYVKYQYSRNPRKINRLFFKRIINLQTLSQVNNYYNNYFTLALKYNFDNVSVQYSYIQSLSAIDSSISKTNSLNFYYKPIKSISLYLTLGNNQQDNLSESQFLRLATGYHW